MNRKKKDFLLFSKLIKIYNLSNCHVEIDKCNVLYALSIF